MADCPRYDLSLLVTLDARDHRTNGFIGPADAMQKMQKLYSENGINPLQVILRIEPHQIVITDATSGYDTEHIHLGMLHQPASITSNHVAGFDNILMFTVVDDSPQLAPPELHIFQCFDKSAQEVVSDLKAAKEGRLFSTSRKQPVQSPNMSSKRKDDYEQESQRLATATISYRPGPAPGQMFRQALSRDSNLSIDSDVTVGKIETLNHCFDDIEKFVGRLQQAANAFRELTRRRKDRHGGTGLGDGMLGMRARPPPASDYVDILQKFKLAFNLLAKLKSHIRNPNAPELIHYLFSPLQLILDTSLDPVTGTSVLATKVYSPLLNDDALMLLSNCMTSLESDLFTSLGQAWNVSRENWPGAVPPYYPHFFDDWSPNTSWLEDVGVGSAAAVAAVATVGVSQLHRNISDHDVTSYGAPQQNNYNGLDTRYPVSKPVVRSQSNAVQMRQQPPIIPVGGRASTGYKMSPRDMISDEDEQDTFRRQLIARRAEICVARVARTSKTDKELPVKEGEILEIFDNTKNWWKVANSSGQIGFVPYTVLKRIEPESSSSKSSPQTPRSAGVAAVSKYNNSINGSNGVGGNGRINATAESLQADVEHKFTKVSPFTGNGRQALPIHPEEIKPARLVPQERNVTDEINEEFKRNLDYQIKPRPARRVEPVVQLVFIDRTSSPEEIGQWLILKGFSEHVRDVLSEYTGRHLFALTRSNCEQLFGSEEGPRVYSQILVQKNRSGFRTPRAAELEAILKMRKSQVENKLDTNF